MLLFLSPLEWILVFAVFGVVYWAIDIGITDE